MRTGGHPATSAHHPFTITVKRCKAHAYNILYEDMSELGSCKGQGGKRGPVNTSCQKRSSPATYLPGGRKRHLCSSFIGNHSLHTTKLPYHGGRYGTNPP